jgi:RNA polymerase sigma factor (sigma-70 family)
MKREEFDDYVDTHYEELTQSAHAFTKEKKILLNSLVEDRDDAATILVHESYIEATSTLHHFDPAYRSPFYWFGGIMDHVIKRLQRCPKRKLQQQLTSDTCSSAQEQLQDDDPLDLLVSLDNCDPEKRYMIHEELDGLLSLLNAQDRNMITLRFFYGMTGAEIAKRLNRTPGHVCTRFSRIFRQLRMLAQERRNNEKWSVKTRPSNSNLLAKNCCSAL